MPKMLIGVFSAYGEAESAVSDLELAGILGEQVEVISNSNRDARAAELGVKPHESVSDRISRLFHGTSRANPTPQVHDEPGEMPDYIGEQEFYATHVRNEGAVMIVRLPNDGVAKIVEGILNQHGSKQHDGREGVTVREMPGRPGIAASA